MQSPQGLLLHGEVGTGKSMLTDLFYSSLPNHKKRRYHFNTFMLDAVSRLEKLRKTRSSISGASGFQNEYSLLWLARDLVEKSPILFLDEFQLPDRMASKLLANLLTAFFQLGGVLVATSNRMPEELSKAAGMEFRRPVSGLERMGWRGWVGFGAGTGGRWKDDGPGQKGEFAAFLEVLKARCKVWEMEGKKDYRRLEKEVSADVSNLQIQKTILDREAVSSEPSSQNVGNWGSHPQAMDGIRTADTQLTDGEQETQLPGYYLITPSPDSSDSVKRSFLETLDRALRYATSATSTQPVSWTPDKLYVYKRPLEIPSQYGGAAILPFNHICGTALGPADYVSLASNYHSICITDVPILTFALKNEARRFITLLDALYEAKCRLLLTVEGAMGQEHDSTKSPTPDELFFPEPPQLHTTSSSVDSTDPTACDPTHAETFSEIHQDLTSPFRPNVSSYLPADALEDDPAPPLRGNRTAPEIQAPDFSNVAGLTGEDEKFAVARARSRIWEICSKYWWEERGEFEKGEEEEARTGHTVRPKWWRPLPRELRHWEGMGNKE